MRPCCSFRVPYVLPLFPLPRSSSTFRTLPAAFAAVLFGRRLVTALASLGRRLVLALATLSHILSDRVLAWMLLQSLGSCTHHYPVF